MKKLFIVLAFTSIALKAKVDIDLILKAFGAKDAHCGICVKNLDDNQYIFCKNDDHIMAPASTVKLYTTGAALKWLGPNYQFKTSVYAKDLSATIKGDVILYGRGDPTLDEKSLNELAANLYKLGVRKIQGNIIASDAAFTSNNVPLGWEIGDLEWYFAPKVSALSVNKNKIKIRFSPSEQGKPAKIKIIQSVPYYKIVNKTLTSRRDTPIDVMHDGKKLIVSGNISRPTKESVSVHDPAMYAGLIFKQALAKNKISVSGSVYSKSIIPTGLKQICSIKSQELSQIIKTMNKSSDNLYAELLVHALGAGSRNSYQLGLQKLKNFLVDNNINRFMIRDGSGLTRNNLTRPKDMVEFLSTMAKSKNKDHFYKSLPIAACDGSLQRRFANTIAANNIHAKSGNMSNVQSLCGYAKTKNQKHIVFSVIINNSLLSFFKNRDLIDNIIVKIIEDN